MSGTAWTEPGQISEARMKHLDECGPSCRCGTYWTEPGQGATVGELNAAVALLTADPLWIHAANAYAHLHKLAMRSECPNGGRLYFDFNTITALALTGEPLTAEDVKRIAEAK